MATELQERIKRAVPIIAGDADIWALFRETDTYREVLREMAGPYRGEVDCVVGVESRGFILGTALALELGVGFVGIRKGEGFFPGEHHTHRSDADYRGNRHHLRLQRDAIGEGEVVLMADDWIETGNQAMAVRGLVESAGGVFYGVATIVDQVEEPRRSELGVFTGIIPNTVLFEGETQRDYASEAQVEEVPDRSE